jgi:DNA-binding NarL/FixJ family response regulator
MVHRSSRADSVLDAARLTPRQQDVLHLLSFRLTNAEIAAALNLSQRTVECHVACILASLQVANRREAAAVARQERGPRAEHPTNLQPQIPDLTARMPTRFTGVEIRKNYR